MEPKDLRAGVENCHKIIVRVQNVVGRFRQEESNRHVKKREHDNNQDLFKIQDQPSVPTKLEKDIPKTEPQKLISPKKKKIACISQRSPFTTSFRMTGSSVKKSSINYSTVIDSPANGSPVNYSSVKDSSVNYSLVNDSAANGSPVNYSSVKDSSVNDSQVNYSSAKDSSFNYSSISDSSVQFSLTKTLPAEPIGESPGNNCIAVTSKHPTANNYFLETLKLSPDRIISENKDMNELPPRSCLGVLDGASERSPKSRLDSGDGADNECAVCDRPYSNFGTLPFSYSKGISITRATVEDSDRRPTIGRERTDSSFDSSPKFTEAHKTIDESQILKVDSLTPDDVHSERCPPIGRERPGSSCDSSPKFTEPHKTDDESQILKVDSVTHDDVDSERRPTSGRERPDSSFDSSPKFTEAHKTIDESQILKVDSVTHDDVDSERRPPIGRGRKGSSCDSCPKFTKSQKTIDESQILKVDSVTHDNVDSERRTAVGCERTDSTPKFTEPQKTVDESQILKVDSLTPDYVDSERRPTVGCERTDSFCGSSLNHTEPHKTNDDFQTLKTDSVTHDEVDSEPRPTVGRERPDSFCDSSPKLTAQKTTADSQTPILMVNSATRVAENCVSIQISRREPVSEFRPESESTDLVCRGQLKDTESNGNSKNPDPTRCPTTGTCATKLCLARGNNFKLYLQSNTSIASSSCTPSTSTPSIPSSNGSAFMPESKRYTEELESDINLENSSDFDLANTEIERNMELGDDKTPIVPQSQKKTIRILIQKAPKRVICIIIWSLILYCNMSKLVHLPVFQNYSQGNPPV